MCASRFGVGASTSASEPAVVSIRSAVSILSLIRIGMPCSGPLTLPRLRSRSSVSAIDKASGLISITLRSWLSISLIRSMYISARRRAVIEPDLS